MRAITEDDYTMEHALSTNFAAQYTTNIATLLENFKLSISFIVQNPAICLSGVFA